MGCNRVANVNADMHGHGVGGELTVAESVRSKQ